MPSSPLRRALRAAGHHLSPVVQVGKEGVTPAVVEQLAGALGAHELVKVKVGTESPEDRFEAAERLGLEAGGQLAQILGRTVLVYRRHPEKPRFEPLTPAEREEKGLLEPKGKAKAKGKREARPRSRPRARARR
jgi:RNA-binding protein